MASKQLLVFRIVARLLDQGTTPQEAQAEQARLMRKTAPELRAILAEQMRFTAHHEPREQWAWAVRWSKNGKAICRANTEFDAKRIASALNSQRDRMGLNDPLTEGQPGE